MDKRVLLSGGVLVGVLSMPTSFLFGATIIGGTYIVYNMLRSSNIQDTPVSGRNGGESPSLSANIGEEG